MLPQTLNRPPNPAFPRRGSQCVLFRKLKLMCKREIQDSPAFPRRGVGGGRFRVFWIDSVVKTHFVFDLNYIFFAYFADFAVLISPYLRILRLSRFLIRDFCRNTGLERGRIEKF